MSKTIALICVLLQWLQLAAPLRARADDNPFTHVPGPVMPANRPRPAPTNAPGNTPVPDRPTPLLPPPGDDPLVCTDPNARTDYEKLPAFQRLVLDYVTAYNADDPLRTHYLAQIARQVFAQPGSDDYIAKLKYIDSQASHSPEAMYDLGRALQNRWEAAFGMEINQQFAGTHETLGQRRADRVRIGEDTGAIVGTLVALAALGIISTRNPAAVPKYYAVFRALLPATGFIGGAALGHGAASGLNASGVFERDIPVAPAHVMHLGVDQDDFTRDDDTLVRTLAPMILSMGAFDATYVAIRGATLATDLLELIRTIRTVGMAAAVADSEIPPAFVATVVVTFLVDKLGTAAVDAYEFGSLKSDVIAARKIVDYGASSGDNVTIYRGADTLVAKSLALAAYVNQPVVEANSEFVAGMAEAAKKYGEGTQAFKDQLGSLARDLSEKVREALEDSDQVGDADFEAYLALEALEHQDASALDDLPDLARDHARSYAEAFQTYRQGFDAYIAQLEEQRQENLGETEREQAYRDYFSQYIHKMRDAKDQQLAAQLRAGDIPRHAGHVLLQAGALLRSTGREYVEGQADFLMAEVAREQALVRAAMAQAAQNQPQMYPGDPGPF